jgi:hypothetical protein
MTKNINFREKILNACLEYKVDEVTRFLGQISLKDDALFIPQVIGCYMQEAQKNRKEKIKILSLLIQANVLYTTVFLSREAGINELELLVKAGVNPNFTQQGRNPLHATVMMPRSLDKIRYCLLELGCDVNSRESIDGY